ncbi:MAG: sensor histidine kinase, partial [Hyphomicrobiaceae bacterium]
MPASRSATTDAPVDSIGSLRKLGYRTMTAVLALTAIGLIVAYFSISTLILLQELNFAAQKHFDRWSYLADRARLILEAREPRNRLPVITFRAQQSYRKAYADAESESRKVEQIADELASFWTVVLFNRSLLREFERESIPPKLKKSMLELSTQFDSSGSLGSDDYTQLLVAMRNGELLSPLHRRTVLASLMAQQCLRPLIAILLTLAVGYLLGLWLLWRWTLSPAISELFRRNEQILAAQHIANLCYWFSPDGAAPEFSPGSARVLGLDGALLPRSLEASAKLSPPDDEKRITSIYHRLSGNDGVREITRRIMSPEYGERVIRERVFSRMVRGQRQLMGIMFDVSDLARASEGWANSEKIRLIELVTAGVAHDFNNILGIMRGHAELMLLRRSFSEQGLKSIMDAADTAVAIIAKLRSRVSFSDLEVQTFHADEAINDCVKSLRALTTTDGDVEIVHKTNKDFILHCNRGLFDNAVVNILTNAIEASPHGSVVTVEVDVVKAGDLLLSGDDAGGLAPASHYGCISITDHGMGMSDAVSRRAFEPFFSTKERG